MTAPSQQIHFRQRNRTYYADLERLHHLLVLGFDEPPIRR